ncbi:hypothetical protein [Streptomyces formicae]|uniref:Lipoprotein n=1 Tax=Streptomyces formicae TaxID=1616117 RepID=A0A291Q5U3_9ACTN|nr:hypothetical protein [Streptomyces formicae]ATL26853.1 hypothetical protein KY5_1835c [Streptomyces formicae]
MSRAGIRAVALGAVAVVGLVAGCGQSAGQDGAAGREKSAGHGAAQQVDRAVAGDHSYPLQKSDIPWSGSPSPFNAQVKLADGRRVAMHYLSKKGLFVQDYSPRAKGWSKPAVVYKTTTDACQGITLKAKDGTVAAFGDFGVYCADGEPPTESVAAVATGRLTTWDKHLTKNFDGWEKIAVAAGGKKVTFSGGGETLRWTKAAGFPG